MMFSDVSWAACARAESVTRSCHAFCRRVLQIQAMGSVRSFCFHRLLLLEQKFNLHVMMNADKEFLAQKSAPHRDFYNVRKVTCRLRLNGRIAKMHCKCEPPQNAVGMGI